MNIDTVRNQIYGLVLQTLFWLSYIEPFTLDAVLQNSRLILTAQPSVLFGAEWGQKDVILWLDTLSPVEKS